METEHFKTPLKVCVKFYTRAEGGRLAPPSGPSPQHIPYCYRAMLRIDGYDHSLAVSFLDAPNTEGWMNALAIILDATPIEPNSDYMVYEGSKRVARLRLL